MKRVLAGLLLAVTASVTTGCSFGSTTDSEPRPDGGSEASFVLDSGAPESGPDSGPDVGPGTASLAWSPASQDFGSVAVGAQLAKTLTLTNSGDGSSGSLKLALASGGSPAPFASSADTCSGQALAPKQTCSVTVTFQPTAAGAASDTLTASAQALTADAALTGTGAASSSLTFSNATFSPVIVGQTGKQTVTLTNGGGATSGNVALSLAGTDAKEFSLASDTCSGKPLAAAGKCTVEVDFTPTTAGAASATLAAAMGSTTVATLPLAATALAPAALAFSTPQPFPSTSVGQKATQTLTLTNGGGVATGTVTLSLGGTSKAVYSLANDTCSTHALAPAAKCTVDVVFAPTAVAAADTATLTATDGTLSATADLTGPAVAPATLAFATVPAFGGVVVGQTKAQTLTLTNSGGVATVAPTFAIASAATGVAAMYTISSDKCSGAAVAAGASCTLVVTFGPTSAGAKTATLTATAGTLTATASLTGTGQSPATLVASATKGTLASTIGKQATQTFTITNSGDQTSGALAAAALTGSAEFVVVTDGCKGVALTSAAGATPSCAVTLGFTASDAVAQTASLTEAASPGGSVAIALTGTSAALLTMSAAQPFTAVVKQTSSQTFTVTNTGGQTSGAPKVTLTGSAVYTKTADTCSGTPIQGVLSGKNTCSVTITFAPTDTTTQTAALTVAATPGSAPSAALTGAGAAPTVAFTLSAGAAALPGYYKYAGTSIGATATETFTVTNTGNVTSAALTVTSLAGTAFTVVPAADLCSKKTLAPAAVCKVDVAFAPGKTIGPSDGILTVTDGTAKLATEIWGPGLSTTAAVVTTIPRGQYGLPAAIGNVTGYDFGTVTNPATASETFTVTNYSTVALAGTMTVTPNAKNPIDFVVSNNGCGAVSLGDYTQSPSCSYAVKFAPAAGAAATQQTAYYGYTYLGDLNYSIPVTGTP